ncbi:MAG: FG-GAP repeat protein [Proteobacteria bacterium]|nr:FG-GAP repeat protein [Pseudomonadota bacterium]
MVQKKTRFSYSTLLFAGRNLAVVVILFCAAGTASAQKDGDLPFDCAPGDGYGRTVVYGGDFNGDGVADFAIGAPCAFVNGKLEAGYVEVRSGVDGRRLLKRKGKQERQFFGKSVAFTHDINGDGKDEVVVGSPGWDRRPLPDPLTAEAVLRPNYGAFHVFESRRGIALRVFGTARQGYFGETVAGLEDTNGDGVADLVIGAPGERNTEGKRSGVVYVYSGQRRKALRKIEGERLGDRFGRTLVAGGDHDGDGVADFIAGSPVLRGLAGEESGVLRVYSGISPQELILDLQGARRDHLGISAASVGDVNGDGLDDIAYGSELADDVAVKKAGTASVASASNGSRILGVVGSQPQKNARFGSSIAGTGDINGDGVPDVVTGAPLADSADGFTRLADAGRFLLFSGSDGSPLLEVEGSRHSLLLGQAVSGGPDLDGDGVSEILVAAPGAAPRQRRGAGSVTAWSPVSGEPVQVFKGRRGLETRVITVGVEPREGRSGFAVFGFLPDRRQRGLRANIFAGTRPGVMSIDLIDDKPKAAPGTLKVVVGSGAGAKHGLVAVIDSARRNSVTAVFDGMQGVVGLVGSNAAGGHFQDEDTLQIIAVQAGSRNGDVVAQVFERFHGPEGTWNPIRRFRVFSRLEEVLNNVRIDAGGATAAAGELISSSGKRDELLVGTESGVSVVRIYSGTGSLLEQWVAYSPSDGHRGASVAIGDVNGDGSNDVVTVPRYGGAQVKAFSADGDPLIMPGQIEPVRFEAFGPDFTGGATLALADIDDDGVLEVLLTPFQVKGGAVSAYEFDGSLVEGWVDLKPYTTGYTSVGGTDAFQRL